MTKEIVSCTVLNHMNLATVERCSRILLSLYEGRGARFEDVLVRERRVGEQGFYVDNRDKLCHEKQRKGSGTFGLKPIAIADQPSA